MTTLESRIAELAYAIREYAAHVDRHSTSSDDECESCAAFFAPETERACIASDLDALVGTIALYGSRMEPRDLAAYDAALWDMISAIRA